ncbi:HlyD family efflux transporter periplasmic adaptor subunit [Dyella telluris]|uniref:HlyD family efflux transporter periplasmic adaptor subunit n=1 Tax=Dyella telluris TaxID=2763498 RepID=A0A7G8Q0Q0_9GAMM|nr:HlyD family efflux transporter periplasmic adaptor subunit [Dyella telluris]QNK00358.1 HlyD family efflux transporter periplasmic adaptor subunit [Dyella telluris]
MDIRHIPSYHDVGWRWVAYAASAILLVAMALAFRIPVELKRDVDCEVLSSLTLRVRTDGGRVGHVYVQPGQFVRQGERLFTWMADALDPSDAAPGRDGVIAPQDGTVAFVNVWKGRSLEKGDVAVVLEAVSTEPLRIVLRIPSEQRGFVQSGQSLAIKLDAFPYARFGARPARIDAISQATIGDAGAAGSFGTVEILKDAAGDYLAWATLGERTFQYGTQKLQVLPGMRGKAAIVVERLTLVEWVFAPLFRIVRG